MQDNIKFGNSYSPYMKDESENVEIWFERYKNDSEKTKLFCEKCFGKIIYRSELCIDEEPLLEVIFVPDTALKIGDTLTDENGLDFVVKSVEMVSFAGNVPEWYFNAPPVVISGEIDNIGAYLRLKTAENE